MRAALAAHHMPEMFRLFYTVGEEKKQNREVEAIEVMFKSCVALVSDARMRLDGELDMSLDESHCNCCWRLRILVLLTGFEWPVGVLFLEEAMTGNLKRLMPPYESLSLYTS